MSKSKKTVAKCGCGDRKSIRLDTYRSNIKRNGKYLCHHCATIKAGADGKYSHTFEMRSNQSKKLWQNQDFRTKITASSSLVNTTTEYREKQSQRTLDLWQDDNYRQRVVASVAEAMANESVIAKISTNLKTRYQIDPDYAIAVGEAARRRFEDDEFRERASKRVKEWWVDNRDELLVIFNSAEHRLKLSSIATELWKDRTYVENVIKQRGVILEPQRLLYSLLSDLNIQYYQEGPQTIIGPWTFDCMIPTNSRHILIEVQSYWHTLGTQQQRDRAKFSYINKYHPEYEIMYIWDYELGIKDRTIDRLLLKLGHKIPIADFSFLDLEIKMPDTNDLRQFLDLYHYIGKGRGGCSFGAYHDHKLVAAIVISPPLRQNIAQQFNVKRMVELSRLCMHPIYHKPNFGSWFISRVMKMLDVDVVIAYADTTVGHTGAVYKASNFKFHHTVHADYWYVDNKGWVMHKKTLYNKARQMKLTEADFASKFGFVKKYGGEKLCFAYYK